MKTKIKLISYQLFSLLIACVIIFSFSACSNDSKTNETQTTARDSYIDISSMNNTMAYSKVCDMTNNPEKYYGKTVKASGICGVYTDKETNKKYYSIIIQDATVCCNQYLEFTLSNGTYPKAGDEITVEGVFGSYQEGKYTYYQLSDAKLV